LVLTDASIAAMQQKDQIFQLGENLPAVCVMRPVHRWSVRGRSSRTACQTGGAPPVIRSHARTTCACCAMRVRRRAGRPGAASGCIV
jgi:hypothetical protein